MSPKSAQLSLSLQPLTIPKGHYLRTLLCEKRALLCEYDPSVTYQNEMTWHTLYKPDGMWLGHIFRDFADEPWQIAATGRENVRGAWHEFNDAISNLLKWREEIEKENIEWRRINCSLSQSKFAEKLEKSHQKAVKKIK